ncbi:hypothetical protein [Tessaracoccus coleopterorum]|uniref:hypothetical protein n=1 Tax=Tessaracoccus coleopterorum TaxID=2714950 RepID=UPI0018D374DD|nr:hypothetical protein [Tessaracoccus coleopterorum]
MFAATSDFGGQGAASLTGRVAQAADELADAVAGLARPVAADGFVEFATLLGR